MNIMNPASDYDVRSLQHERRMLELYRKSVANDGALLQPLANACWRAASFEWRLYEDATAVCSLWKEAARALGEGFIRRRAGFEKSADQLIFGLHFAIAARTSDVEKSLVHATAATPSNSGAPRFARASLLLLEGYQGVLRALIEREVEHARAAQHLLMEAQLESERDERGLPFAGDAAWKAEEHESTRVLLSVIAGVLATKTLPRADFWPVDYEAASLEFSRLIDASLSTLNRFVETEVNHRPKLYCWLPGIALSILAVRAGLSLDWIDVRRQRDHDHYSRLPLRLLDHADTLRARA
jgi:hypothetical protein